MIAQEKNGVLMQRDKDRNMSTAPIADKSQMQQETKRLGQETEKAEGGKIRRINSASVVGPRLL